MRNAGFKIFAFCFMICGAILSKMLEPSFKTYVVPTLISMGFPGFKPALVDEYYCVELWL